MTVTQNDNVHDEILRAALQLYRKFGTDKVTMDDVANAIGRSRTFLYYYYKNRDEIFQAVLDTVANDVANQVRSEAAKAGTLQEKIYAFCLAKLKAGEDWKSIFREMWSSMDADEKSGHGKAMVALHKKLVRLEGIILNDILAAGMYQQHIRAITPGEQDNLIFIIASSIRGLRREIYELNDPHDITTAIRLLTDMIVKWLKD